MCGTFSDSRVVLAIGNQDFLFSFISFFKNFIAKVYLSLSEVAGVFYKDLERLERYMKRKSYFSWLQCIGGH